MGCTSPAVHLAAPKSRGWLIIWGDDASKRYNLSYQPSVWWPWRGFLGQPRRGLSPSSGDKPCLVSLWSSSTGKADKERGRSRPWHPPTLTRGQRGKQHPPACPLGQFRCGFFFFFASQLGILPRGRAGGRQRWTIKGKAPRSRCRARHPRLRGRGPSLAAPPCSPLRSRRGIYRSLLGSSSIRREARPARRLIWRTPRHVSGDFWRSFGSQAPKGGSFPRMLSGFAVSLGCHSPAPVIPRAI